MHKKWIRIAFTSILLFTLLIAVTSFSGCKGRKSARAPKPKPAVFTAEELAEGFVVTRLMGSTVVKLADGIELAPPPYEFFFTLTNPDSRSKRLMFSSPNNADFVVKKGEIEIFRYSKRFPGRGNPEEVELKPKAKKSWRLQWDGKLVDGKRLEEGIYTLEFILNTEPVQSLTFSDISFKFPEEEPPE